MHYHHPAVNPADWPHRTGSHSFCPRCGSPDVRLAQRLSALPLGTYSIAGAQMKVVARYEWHYRGFECGDTAECGIRDSTTERLAREGRTCGGSGCGCTKGRTI